MFSAMIAADNMKRMNEPDWACKDRKVTNKSWSQPWNICKEVDIQAISVKIPEYMYFYTPIYIHKIVVYNTWATFLQFGDCISESSIAHAKPGCRSRGSLAPALFGSTMAQLEIIFGIPVCSWWKCNYSSWWWNYIILYPPIRGVPIRIWRVLKMGDVQKQ